ncbi:MAG: YccF domain-containing protein [Paludibacteraceae bacterium]|jgi:uncharacterized membrane protein YccF (DUF307 family)|nr:YccF domain-containing protein [Paludibacteraceae bacterium]
MQILGNIIWIVCGGFLTAAEYFVGAIGCFLTVVGIPFGIQLIKLGKLALLPFGNDVNTEESESSCLSTVFNIIWLFTGGFAICLTHLLFGLLLAITIIGIPFAKQHFKLMKLAFFPFGKKMKLK